MSDRGEAELDPPFETLEPADWLGPFVFNSPHSGCTYPAAFLRQSRLEMNALRRSEDTFVDELFEPAVQRGFPLMRAHFPRCYIDLNREPYELDPRMFDGRLPSFANTRSMRVAGGLGTVARVVGDAQEIYQERIPVAEAMRRIDVLYKPYHRGLRKLMLRTQRAFGTAVLVDCHSMPSSSHVKDERPRADIVIGDRYGTSCAPAITLTLEAAFESLGYTVNRNKPYAGGFITEHYGNPSSGLHAVQIELNRALYMDERRFERSPTFERVRQDIDSVIGVLARISLDELLPFRTAAE